MIGSLDDVEILSVPKSIGVFGELGDVWLMRVRLPCGKVVSIKACEAEASLNGVSRELIFGWRIRDALKRHARA